MQLNTAFDTLKPIVLSLFIFIIWNSQAQVEKEILTYQDSSRFIINNGRELIVDKIASYDFKGADEVYFYLQEKALEKQQLAFSYSEIIYINLITGNYAELLDYCKNYKTKSFLKVFSAERSIRQDLYQHFMEQVLDIKNDLQYTQLNTEELALLKLIIYVIEKEHLAGDYSGMLADFKEKYPDSEYLLFMDNFLPSAPIKSSFTWDMGPTIVSPQGEMGKTFNTTTTFGMSFDFNIRKIYTSFYINTGDMRANKAFSIQNTNLYINDDYTYFNGGAKFGYFLCRNNRFHLAPYVSISGTTLRTNIYEGEEYNDAELELSNCFSYGAGIHSEIKLFEFSAPYYYGFYGFYAAPSTSLNQFFALKLDFGYNINTKSDYVYFEGNTFQTYIGIVWGFGIF